MAQSMHSLFAYGRAFDTGLLAAGALALIAVVGRRTRPRVRAAIAVTVAALAWGFVLELTSPIPATVPMLAGLAVTWPGWWRGT